MGDQRAAARGRAQPLSGVRASLSGSRSRGRRGDGRRRWRGLDSGVLRVFIEAEAVPSRYIEDAGALHAMLRMLYPPMRLPDRAIDEINEHLSPEGLTWVGDLPGPIGPAVALNGEAVAAPQVCPQTCTPGDHPVPKAAGGVTGFRRCIGIAPVLHVAARALLSARSAFRRGSGRSPLVAKPSIDCVQRSCKRAD